MLNVKNISKAYLVGEITTRALDDLSIAFREKEFVAILGKSGSGKTTFLNIIGGLDRYDSGDLIIKGKETRTFKDKDWDAYRNNSIGFVFQSYNLINHISIVANVELGMTLSGVSSSEKHRRAVEVLKQVGLEEHLHKKPNQLSGGQQQRVAIARALANDPEILLCDEPTGALDSTTSKQIMDLIQSIASDRLVIMVTHNPDLAHRYADRIVEFEDGRILSDSNPYESQIQASGFKLKHTSMSFFTALRLSFNNIMTKKGRTFLTSFASSIGIIGIAVILSLSSGFQIQIDNFQAEAMSEFPIMISQSSVNLDEESLADLQQQNSGGEPLDPDALTAYDPSETTLVHQNILSQEFIDHLNQIDPQAASNLGFSYLMNLNLVREVEGEATLVSLNSSATGQSGPMASNSGLSTYPISLNPEEPSILEKNYDVLAGSLPSADTDMVLVVDSQNRVDVNLLASLGFDTDDIETVAFEDLIGLEMQWIPNDLYYEQTSFGTYIPAQDLNAMAEASDITLTLSGIVRLNDSAQITLLNTGIVYSDALVQRLIDLSLDSEIARAQQESDVSVFTLEPLEEESKRQLLAYIGASNEPYMITVYPQNFETKDQVLAYLDAYNEGKDLADRVVYVDLASTLSNLTQGIMDGITIVLIAFAAISLVVSLIMIGIITYTSVIERTKEIGILKALGARKKDITRVFDAETFILGVFSGSLGIAIAYLLTLPINAILYQMTELSDVAQLKIDHALMLVVISTVLTMIGGHIPAKIASNKDAVVALRSE